MKFRYTKKDFDFEISTKLGQEVANKANALLEAHEKTLPRVRGRAGEFGFTMFDERARESRISGSYDYHGTDTHTALLWGIEEIK